MGELFHVSSNPHIRASHTTGRIMMTVLIALMPAAVFGIFNFGMDALVTILLSMASCVATEYIYEKLMHKKITISDCSAAVTGLLLALNLPASVPWWIPVLGGIFAILIVKQLFGGLGQNFMNPALTARCFLLISFTGRMTTFTYDGIAGATPLGLLKSGESVDVLSMFLGTTRRGNRRDIDTGYFDRGSFPAVEKSDFSAYSRNAPGSVCYLCDFVRRSWIGLVLPRRTVMWRRINAGSIFYGDRLCNFTDHKERAADLWRYTWNPDRIIPNFRKLCGGCIVCHHFSNLLVPLIDRVTIPKDLEKEAKNIEENHKRYVCFNGYYLSFRIAPGYGV